MASVRIVSLLVRGLILSGKSSLLSQSTSLGTSTVVKVGMLFGRHQQQSKYVITSTFGKEVDGKSIPRFFSVK